MLSTSPKSSAPRVFASSSVIHAPMSARFRCSPIHPYGCTTSDVQGWPVKTSFNGLTPEKLLHVAQILVRPVVLEHIETHVGREPEIAYGRGVPLLARALAERGMERRHGSIQHPIADVERRRGVRGAALRSRDRRRAERRQDRARRPYAEIHLPAIPDREYRCGDGCFSCSLGFSYDLRYAQAGGGNGWSRGCKAGSYVSSFWTARTSTAAGEHCCLTVTAAAAPAAAPIAMAMHWTRYEACASWLPLMHRPAKSRPSIFCGTRHP